MAIEDFGNSLLSAQQEKNEKLYKQLREDKRKDAKDYLIDSLKYRLAGTAVKGVLDTALNVGNEMVKNRTVEYLNSEDAMAKKALIASTLESVENINNEIEAINNHEGGETGYFTDRALADINIGFNVQGFKGDGNYSQQQLDDYKTILVQMRAKDLMKSFNQAKSKITDLASRGITSIEDYDKLIAEASPQSISGFFADKVQKTFTGKDPLKTFFKTNKDLFDNTEKNRLFFEAYENVSQSLLTAEDLAEAAMTIEKATGKKFEIKRKKDVSYGDKITNIRILGEKNKLTREQEIIEISAVPIFANGVLTGYATADKLLEINESDIVETDVTSNNNDKVISNEQYNFQDEKFLPYINDVLATFNVDKKHQEAINAYIKIFTTADTNILSQLSDTSSLEDEADRIYVNDFYGKMLITRSLLQDNYGYTSDTANLISDHMHTLNVLLQTDLSKIRKIPLTDINFLENDYADRRSEVNKLQSPFIGGNLYDGGATGGWNSLIAVMSANQIMLDNNNLGFGQFNNQPEAVEAINDLIGIDAENLKRDVKNMTVSSLAATSYMVENLIEQYKSDKKETNFGDTYKDKSAYNIRTLQLISRIIDERSNELFDSNQLN
jgi:hypothetical protein|tara:strand:+ start:11985 stop:13820 length:1836 start_codon:yes stop_codon:yes gene_type:complete